MRTRIWKLVTFAALLVGARASAQDGPFGYAHEGDILQEEVRSIAFGFTPDNRDLLFAGTRSGTIVVYDLADREKVKSLERNEGIVRLAATPDPAVVVAADSDERLFAWDWQEDSIRELVHTDNDIRSLGVSWDGRLVAAADKKAVTVVNLDTGSVVAKLTDKRHKDDLLFASFVEGSETLVTWSKDKVHILWDLQSQRAIRTNVEEFDEAFGAAYSPSGILALAGVNIYSLGAVPLTTSQGDLNASNTFATYVDQIKILNLKGDGSEIKILDGQGQDEDIAFISISADNKYIATSGKARSVKIWDVLSGSINVRLETDDDIRDLAFSPDGEWLVAATKRGARVWRTVGIIAHRDYAPLLPRQSTIYVRDQPPLLDFDQFATVGLEPFRASDDLAAEAETVTGLLRDYLVNGDGFQLADLESRNSIIDERAFGETGLTEEADLGKLPHVDWVLRGSLRRLGANMILNLQLVSVATGLTDGARTVECRQCSDEDLTLAVQKLAAVTVK